MPVRNIQILVLVMVVCVACYWQAEQLKYGGRIGLAISKIQQNYVEQTDPEQLYFAAMRGLVSELDPYSAFISPTEYSEFQSVIEQQFGGLGVFIEGPPAVDQLTVVAPMPGTPAFEAGLQPGDTIVAIEGESTEGLSATEAMRKLRGPVGKPVTLRVRRLNQIDELTVRIERDDIPVNSIYGDRIQGDSTWNYFLEEDPRIAYIRITMFGERTTDEFRNVLNRISGQAEALVLDLRYNPGGILPSAVEMCDMLVGHGTIVSTKGRSKFAATVSKSHAGVEFDRDVPIVVLVNEQSASASEIMAGCLQDHGRAKIAGARSYGKGTVQQVFELENDSTALKFTTARFYRPSGKNIHRLEDMSEQDEWGVIPDPELQLKLTDVEDLYLHRRWQQRGDPRITTATERPPAPRCAGDPQLRRVFDYLQVALQDSQSLESIK